MFSSSDALFTLYSSSGASKGTSITNNKSSAATGVCFVQDPTEYQGNSISIRGNTKVKCGSSESRSDDKSCVYETSDSSDESEESDGALNFRCSNLLLGPRGSKFPKSSLESQSLILNFDGRGKALPDEASSSFLSDVFTEQAAHIAASSSSLLSGSILASCHADGSAKLWDLATRRCIVEDICNSTTGKIGVDMVGRGGAGLALRRIGPGHDRSFLFQTRDASGTITLHDLHRPCDPLLRIHTRSRTFCAMAPCSSASEGIAGVSNDMAATVLGAEQNLVAIPSEEETVAMVRDLRCDPTAAPAYRIVAGSGRDSIGHATRGRGTHGMITSMALCMQESSHRLVLGCGMESGSILFYDLNTLGKGRSWRIDSSASTHDPRTGHISESGSKINFTEDDIFGIGTSIGQFHVDNALNDNVHESQHPMCSVKVAKDPVLCLDLASSTSLHQDKASPSKKYDEEAKAPYIVAISGCAGDIDELSKLPEKDQGTVAITKVALGAPTTTTSGTAPSTKMKATLRTKTHTYHNTRGKLGASTIRFRPDGRLFAIGGWDHRLHLYGRTSAKHLGTWHGHEESVVAVDWAAGAATSGLIATGGSDGKICLWRIFPHSLRKR